MKNIIIGYRDCTLVCEFWGPKQNDTVFPRYVALSFIPFFPFSYMLIEFKKKKMKMWTFYPSKKLVGFQICLLSVGNLNGLNLQL